MLRIYLLGGFQVEIDAEPLRLSRQQGLVELWAYLVLHPLRPIQRDQLAFMLWPDETEEAARARLRQCLFQINKLLPRNPDRPPWLLTEGRTLRWNPSANYWLDVDQFSQAVNRPIPEDEWVQQESTNLELYRGDLLPDCSAAWLLPLRSRLHDEYIARLVCLIEIYLQREATPAALAAARRLVQIDAASETAQRRLIDLLYRSGDRVGALRQFDEYLALLERDGTPGLLSPQTLALRQAVTASTIPASPAPLAAATQPASRSASQETHRTQPGLRLRPGRFARLAAGVMACVVLAGGLWAASWLYRFLTPVKIRTISGPQAVEDTWIASADIQAMPAGEQKNAALYVDLHDGRGWINPDLPFAQYPAARLNLSNNTVADILLFFRLEVLPPGSYVEKASLNIFLEPDRMMVDTKHHPRPITIAAYRLLRPWEADTATFAFPWSETGLRSGVDYEAQPLCQQTVSSISLLTLDLTPAFPAWQKGQNFGVIIRVIESPTGISAYWMPTTEHPDPLLRPRLVIQYR